MRTAWRVGVGAALAFWVVLLVSAIWVVATSDDGQRGFAFAPVVLLGMVILPIAYTTFTPPPEA